MSARIEQLFRLVVALDSAQGTDLRLEVFPNDAEEPARWVAIVTADGEDHACDGVVWRAEHATADGALAELLAKLADQLAARAKAHETLLREVRRDG